MKLYTKPLKGSVTEPYDKVHMENTYKEALYYQMLSLIQPADKKVRAILRYLNENVM